MECETPKPLGFLLTQNGKTKPADGIESPPEECRFPLLALVSQTKPYLTSRVTTKPEKQKNPPQNMKNSQRLLTPSISRTKKKKIQTKSNSTQKLQLKKQTLSTTNLQPQKPSQSRSCLHLQ